MAVAPSRLNTPDSQAGMGLFGIRPKHPQYTKRAHLRHLFARQGDFICSYQGPIRTPTECVTQPSMYLFSDPADPQHRYIDSWSADTGSPATAATLTKASTMNKSTVLLNGHLTVQPQEYLPNVTSSSMRNS